jgi:putative redox protein
MGTKTLVTWSKDMAFDVELQGHHFSIDADAQFGGNDLGPRPKALLLSGLAGCTGMDVVSLLKKMRMEWDSFALEVEGELTDEHPKVYKEIRIKYLFRGDKLEENKIKKAVSLSQEKYCGVTTMLGKTADIKVDILLNPDTAV